jgi:hypothetical protein
MIIDKKRFFTFCFFYFISATVCQEVPNEFYKFKEHNCYMNIEKNWDIHTTFGPPSIQMVNDTIENNINFLGRYGFLTINKNFSFYSYGFIKFKKYFYLSIYSRIVNDVSVFPRYSGLPLGQKRIGFNSGESDIANLGYNNGNFLFQIGRGRQSWGAGEKINLVISEDSQPYDYNLIGINLGKFKLRSINGFLESDSLTFNRYISCRGLEYKPKSNLLISFSEFVIYSGENRPLDYSYLNPLSTHLEIERNNKQNWVGTNSGNGIWQLSIDYMLNPFTRISSNFAFDEIAIDKSERDGGKNHSIAQSHQINYSLIQIDDKIINFYLTYVNVGTPTFRHELGRNNFVIRGKPLGWQNGSDGFDFFIGIKMLKKESYFGKIRLGYSEYGQNSIKNNPYRPYSIADYNSDIFPSGIVVKTLYADINLQWWFQQNISFFLSSKIYDSSTDGAGINLNVGLDVFFPISN